jgi:hypothetical protein
VRSKVDHYVYSKEEGGHFIYVALYVDDMLLVGNNMEAIKEVKMQLSFKINMKDRGVVNFIKGMDIKRDQAIIKLWLYQRKYIEMVLNRFNMQDCKLFKVQIPMGVKLTAK